jgi:hypothetical protein
VSLITDGAFRFKEFFSLSLALVGLVFSGSVASVGGIGRRIGPVIVAN